MQGTTLKHVIYPSTEESWGWELRTRRLGRHRFVIEVIMHLEGVSWRGKALEYMYWPVALTRTVEELETRHAELLLNARTSGKLVCRA